MSKQKTRTTKERFFLFLKGLGMGAANKVPGVSGGIVAFVTGFYEELIYSFNKFNGKSLKLLLNGRFKSFFQYVNARFLLLIFSGSLFSYFSVSLFLDYLLKNYERYVWSFFFGLIIGSIYYIAKNFEGFSKKSYLYIFIGVAIGISISFLSPAKENSNLWFVFLCGIIGVSGMTLPGLSGSFILMLLGNYVLLLVDSVNELLQTIIELFSGDFSFIENEGRMKYLKVIGSFTAGSAVGLVITSQILGYVLKRWHNIVTALILGFITGSLGNVWPWKEKIYKIINNEFLLDSERNKIMVNYKRFIPDFSLSETYFAIFFTIIGIAILVLIQRFNEKQQIHA